MQIILNTIQIIFFASATIACIIYVLNQRKKIIQESPNPLQIYQDVFNAINYAIKNNKPTLRYDVNHMSVDEFMPLYRGIKKNYPALKMDVKVDPKYRKVNHPNGGEYFLFETGQYNGVFPLTLKLDMTTYENKNITPSQTPIHHSNVVPLFRTKNNSALNLSARIESVIKEDIPKVREDNVIDLQAYRNKKQIYKPSS